MIIEQISVIMETMHMDDLAADNNILPQKGDHVLWIRFWALGDVLQSGAEAMLFKERFPDTRLTFLTEPAYADLLAEQPWCDSVIAGYKRPWPEFKATLGEIKSNKFDWVISKNHGGKTALLSIFSGVKNRVGTTAFPFFYTESLDHFFHKAGIDIKDRSHPSFFADTKSKKWVDGLLAGLPEKKLFAIVGASNERKMWPIGHWHDFLSQVADSSWGIILVGSGSEERAFAERLELGLNSKNIINTVDRLDLLQLAAIASSCDIAVGNDTGVLHLSSLIGTPTIGLSDYDQFDWLDLTMPWFTGLSAMGKPTKHINSIRGRSAEYLAEISPEQVLETFLALNRRINDKYGE